MIPLAALPLLSMGCFGNVLRSVCGRSSKLVDKSIVNYGAELLSQAVPKAFDRFVEADSRRKRFLILEALSLALEPYRQGYTLNIVARWLRGVSNLSVARDACREAGYTIASRSRDLGEWVTEAMLSLLDYDLMITDLLPRLGIWGFSRRLANAKSELSELLTSVATVSAAIAIAAEGWGRGGRDFERVSRVLDEELSEVIDSIDPLLDTVAVLVDPENEVVAREVVKGGES